MADDAFQFFEWRFCLPLRVGSFNRNELVDTVLSNSLDITHFLPTKVWAKFPPHNNSSPGPSPRRPTASCSLAAVCNSIVLLLLLLLSIIIENDGSSRSFSNCTSNQQSILLSSFRSPKYGLVPPNAS